MIRRSGFAVLAVGVILLLTAAPAFAISGGGTPVPPNSQPFGRTYGEWGGMWWIWAFGIPVSQSPLIDPTGANCAVQQSGPVWYLAGTCASETVGNDVIAYVDRRCQVPFGKYLFFPVFNAECSTVEGNGHSYKQLLRCASGFMDVAKNVRAEWDGAPIAGDPMSTAYRVQSPLMTFVLPGPTPQDNLLGLTPGPSNFATDGYYVMLTPPALG